MSPLYHITTSSLLLTEHVTFQLGFVTIFLITGIHKTPYATRAIGTCNRWHREGAYSHLLTEKDAKTLEAVHAFNPYDLYSKSDAPRDVAELRPYYEGLIAKFFPEEINW